MSEQLSLFSEVAPGPDGLLLPVWCVWGQAAGRLSRRHYDYSQQKLKQAEDLPDWIAPLTARVETWAGLPAAAIRQLLFTEYGVGVGIGWHRDKPHFEQVLGLSIASACKFRFRRKTEGGWERYTLQAEPRSLT